MLPLPQARVAVVTLRLALDRLVRVAFAGLTAGAESGGAVGSGDAVSSGGRSSAAMRFGTGTLRSESDRRGGNGRAGGLIGLADATAGLPSGE